MNSIVLYYSYHGHTKKVAEKLARAQNAELVEVKTRRRQNALAAYLVECPRARMRKLARIQPIDQDLTGYDFITLASPVWAGFPAPAFNAMTALLPKGKNVQVVLVSGHGSGATKKSAEGTKHQIRQQGCTVVGYKEVKQPE
ncbi:MAG: hypothetical protein PHO41_05035 [Eubacteriales bacterium]|nr:hypothetical protein [Eubacteriales bacterium]